MNLITAIRQQFKQMDNWYLNALMTNIILDYLDMETPEPQRNIQIIQELIESGRVKSYYEGTKTPGMVFYVDEIRVFTVFDTVTDIKGGSYSHLEEAEINIRYSYRRDFKDRPSEKSESVSSNVVEIHSGGGKDEVSG